MQDKKGKEATEISRRLKRRDEGAGKTSADWQAEQSLFPLQLVLCSQQSRTGKTLIHSMMGESFRQGGVRGHCIILPFTQDRQCC